MDAANCGMLALGIGIINDLEFYGALSEEEGRTIRDILRNARKRNEQDSPEEKKKAYIVWLNDGYSWSFSNIFHKRDQAEFYAKDVIRRSQDDDSDENWTEFEIEERVIE